MKDKNFDNFLDKIRNRSESFKYTLKRTYALFDEYSKPKTLDQRLEEYKNADEPEEELEEFIQDFVNDWKGNTVTLKQYVKNFNRYFKYWRFTVDFKNIEWPTELKEEKYALSLDEIKLILENSDFRQKAIYTALESTGARPIEVLGLRKKDIEWFEDRYKALIPAVLTKKKIARTVFFHKECTPYIRVLLKNETDLVFGTNEILKHSVVTQDTILRNKLEKLGMDKKYETTGRNKINLYCLRGYMFTKALRYFKDDIAHALIGHGAYLQQYQRRTDQEKYELWKELENEILIYNQKAEPKIEEMKKLYELEIQKLSNRIDILENQNIENGIASGELKTN